MKITLVCAGGMSTSILVQTMVSSANKQALKCEIQAVAISRAKQEASDSDVILCAPQVKFQEAMLKEQLPHVTIATISMIDYGMMDGESVLKQAVSLVENA
ncbi:PTS sugar transporter subunit IIB [Erysipelothrix urinaevulpis]|uniref:PTS sugar transporter subunit IIB n=1 Tax=Erysipelothrix urinaevulpis TaxID=2683717 RepID=UPI0013578706|nr:PTS sugar transporter subunit IIB [Erysipelothrix urinaevulpis]